MKRNHLIILVLLVAISPLATLRAQDGFEKYRKDQRISDQLKNGGAPGAKIGPGSSKKAETKESSSAVNVSYSKQLKSGTLPGANIARGGGGSTARSISTNARRAGAAGGKLPSETASSQAGTETRTISNGQAPKLDQGGVKEVLVAPAPAKATKPAGKGGTAERSAKPAQP